MITMSYSCRRLEIREFFFGKWSIMAPNIEELCLVTGRGLLSRSIIGQVAAMTSLRSLELRGWSAWRDMKPLASLTLLTRLTCNQGLRLMADMLQPGCLQSLEVASAPRMILHLCSALSLQR